MRGPGGQLYHGAAVSLGGLHLKEDFYCVGRLRYQHGVLEGMDGRILGKAAGIFYSLITPLFSVLYISIYFIYTYIFAVRTTWCKILISTSSIQNRHSLYMPCLREKIKAA